MSKNTIIYISITVIIFLAIILITIGVIKIFKANKEINKGVKEVEEIFGTGNNIDGENSSLQKETQNNKNDINNAIGLITFKLKKEYKTAIYNNITEENLRKGAGRASGSSELNEIGNCVLYGHRDSAFRALWDIKVGDIAEVKTKSNIIKYEVKKIYVTSSEDTNIFKQNLNNKEIKLTLVTCYPFIYSGPANERCVVELECI